MNVKTTSLLAIILIGLLTVYFMSRSSKEVTESEKGTQKAATTSFVGDSLVAQSLVDPKIENVDRLEIQREGKPMWVFERSDEMDDVGRPRWRMLEPLPMDAVSWEMDRITREINDLQYEMSYRVGDAGSPTPKQAGLEPPRLSITISGTGNTSNTTSDSGDANDNLTANVEIGAPASSSTTYARLKGEDRIVVAQSNLQRLIKDNAVEYRDPQVWSFNPANVQRVEITAQSSGTGTSELLDTMGATGTTNWRFVRDGSRWMMESPAAARATGKVDDLLKAISGLRVMKWVDHRSDRLTGYGLEPSAWTVRVTEEVLEVSKPSETKEGGDEEKDKAEETNEAPKTQLTVYELHVADRSPIDDENKVFVRVNDDSTVGTIAKTVAEKLKPKMDQWRDMHVTTADLSNAVRIGLSTPSEQAVLIKDLGRWEFKDNQSAEHETVEGLLNTLEGLSATAFVEFDAGDSLTAFGLDAPRATILVTLPGGGLADDEEGNIALPPMERFAIGSPTEQTTKRLTYVRRNESNSIAKVRSADVKDLLRGPLAYHDRTITGIPSSRVQSVRLTIESPYSPTPLTQRFERNIDGWLMKEPVESLARGNELTKLVDTVTSLRAKAVAATDTEDLSVYELDAPQAVLAITYEPPREYRIETDDTEGANDTEETGDVKEAGDKSEGGEPTPTKTVEVHPPPKMVELWFSRKNDKYFAKRADSGTIYEIEKAAYDPLFAEYRPSNIFNFDENEVARFSIHHGNQTYVFERHEDQWVYQVEPDLPLDREKVQNLLLQLKDLETNRFVTYTSIEIAEFGLDNPAVAVELRMKGDNNSTHRLIVADRQPQAGSDRGFYAQVTGRAEVFLLPTDTIKRLEISLDDLEAKP